MSQQLLRDLSDIFGEQTNDKNSYSTHLIVFVSVSISACSDICADVIHTGRH